MGGPSFSFSLSLSPSFSPFGSAHIPHSHQQQPRIPHSALTHLSTDAKVLTSRERSGAAGTAHAAYSMMMMMMMTTTTRTTMMVMMMMTSVRTRTESSGDGQTPRARDAQHNTTETVRAPETALTNVPAYALARRHSRETQPGLRAAHKQEATTRHAHTGPLTTAQPTTNRRTVSGDRRHETRHRL